MYGTFYELSKTGKSTETQNRQVIVRGWSRGMTESECSVETEFPLEVMSCIVVIVASYCRLTE